MFLDLGDFGEPVVFAVDGTHVADEGIQVNVFQVVVFVRHMQNIYNLTEICLNLIYYFSWHEEFWLYFGFVNGSPCASPGVGYHLRHR